MALGGWPLVSSGRQFVTSEPSFVYIIDIFRAYLLRILNHLILLKLVFQNLFLIILDTYRLELLSQVAA